MKFIKTSLVCVLCLFLVLMISPKLFAGNENCVHDYEITVINPTCTNDGEVTLTCKNCGRQKFVTSSIENVTVGGEETTYDQGHVYVPYTVDTNNHTIEMVCLICGSSYTKNYDPDAQHVYEYAGMGNGGTVSCAESVPIRYTCVNHGEVKNEQINPKYHELAVAPKVEATCEEDGHSEYVYCLDCGKIFLESETYPKTGHNYEVTEITDEYTLYTCTKCKDFYKEDAIDSDDDVVNKQNQSVQMKNGWNQIDGAWYYVQNGVTVDGWKKINTVWYYFDDCKMVTGLFDVDGDAKGLYYFNEKGAMQKGWQKVDDTWYFFENSGIAKNGWYKENGKWYYLIPEMLSDTTITLDETTYRFQANGAMVTGWHQDIDGNWRYYDKSGAQVSGWQKVGTKWYYLDPQKDDVMVCKRQMKIDGVIYTFNSSGAWVKQ